MLRDYSIDEIKLAFETWLEVGENMPVPAKIVKIIKANRPLRKGPPLYLQIEPPARVENTEEEHQRILQGFATLRIEMGMPPSDYI